MSEHEDRLLGMDADELLREHLGAGSPPDSPLADQLRVALNARIARDLTTTLDGLRESIDAAARGSARLQLVLVVLTAVIAIATVVGALAAWA
jgi:hypothetical protein